MLSFCKFLDKHFLSALHSDSRGVENLLANGIHPVSVNFLRPFDSLVSLLFVLIPPKFPMVGRAANTRPASSGE